MLLAKGQVRHLPWMLSSGNRTTLHKQAGSKMQHLMRGNVCVALEHALEAEIHPVHVLVTKLEKPSDPLGAHKLHP